MRFMAERIEPEISTRRGLLRALARTAARQTREGADALGPGGLQGLLNPDAPPSDWAEDPTLQGPARLPARQPERTASLDELLALAHEEGLTQRDNELRGLAMRSLRMTPVEPPHSDAWILTSDDWIASGDEVLLAQIKLDATSIHDCELPVTGWLALFVEAADAEVGSEVRHAHGVLLDLPAAIPHGAEPVAFSPELVLPRRWHESVQALDFDDTEAEAYDRLRARLQLLQGVESDDDGGSGIAYHRLLGYPNETTGSMPSDCVRALRDRSAADGRESDLADPLLPSHQWRLLTQISVGQRRRTYVWIRSADLTAGEFGKLCAFVR
jgi:uncharacterized protein DUF1963